MDGTCWKRTLFLILLSTFSKSAFVVFGAEILPVLVDVTGNETVLSDLLHNETAKPEIEVDQLPVGTTWKPLLDFDLVPEAKPVEVEKPVVKPKPQLLSELEVGPELTVETGTPKVKPELHEIPEILPETLPGTLPETLPELLEKLPPKLPSELTLTTDKLAEKSPDTLQMPETLPEKLPETLPGKLPGKFPVHLLHSQKLRPNFGTFRPLSPVQVSELISNITNGTIQIPVPSPFALPPGLVSHDPMLWSVAEAQHPVVQIVLTAVRGTHKVYQTPEGQHVRLVEVDVTGRTNDKRRQKCFALFGFGSKDEDKEAEEDEQHKEPTKVLAGSSYLVDPTTGAHIGQMQPLDRPPYQQYQQGQGPVNYGPIGVQPAAAGLPTVQGSYVQPGPLGQGYETPLYPYRPNEYSASTVTFPTRQAGPQPQQSLRPQYKRIAFNFPNNRRPVVRRVVTFDPPMMYKPTPTLYGQAQGQGILPLTPTLAPTLTPPLTPPATKVENVDKIVESDSKAAPVNVKGIEATSAGSVAPLEKKGDEFGRAAKPGSSLLGLGLGGLSSPGVKLNGGLKQDEKGRWFWQSYNDYYDYYDYDHHMDYNPYDHHHHHQSYWYSPYYYFKSLLGRNSNNNGKK